MKILFGVSSVGLGHVRRSLEIASELRKLIDCEIDWISSEPVVSFLRSRGESPLPVCAKLQSHSDLMERRVKDGRLEDISLVARGSYGVGRENYNVLRETLSGYDALIQDEFIETMFSFMWDNDPPLPEKRVVVTDYFQFRSSSPNPFHRVVTWYANRMLAKAYQNSGLRIFADDRDSSPKNLPEFEIVGPIVPKAPLDSKDRLRSKLFSGNHRTVIVVAVGGTSTGKYIVDFILSNRDSILGSLGDVLLVFMLGPKLSRMDFAADSSNITFVQFTTEAISYFKAADCVICQSGGSTLNEVASLGTPCMTIPIKNHWEQEANAARFSKKFGFQVIEADKLTPRSIVGALQIAMNSKYEPLISNGASRAAGLVADYLSAG